jgi:hypothetical protein
LDGCGIFSRNRLEKTIKELEDKQEAKKLEVRFPSPEARAAEGGAFVLSQEGWRRAISVNVRSIGAENHKRT